MEVKKPGRPVKYGPTTMVRVQKTQHAKVKRNLWPWESVADFMRLAIKKRAGGAQESKVRRKTPRVGAAARGVLLLIDESSLVITPNRARYSAHLEILQCRSWYPKDVDPAKAAEAIGVVPYWLDEDDPRQPRATSSTSITSTAAAGIRSSAFKLLPDGSIKYPGDPPLKPIAGMPLSHRADRVLTRWPG